MQWVGVRLFDWLFATSGDLCNDSSFAHLCEGLNEIQRLQMTTVK
jgi:hypothetical protein